LATLQLEACPQCNSTHVEKVPENTWWSRVSGKYVTDPAYMSCKNCGKVTRLTIGTVSGDRHTLFFKEA
jgi:ribosomal protein L37AE/L43A